jgi:hypothetical protein
MLSEFSHFRRRKAAILAASFALGEIAGIAFSRVLKYLHKAIRSRQPLLPVAGTTMNKSLLVMLVWFWCVPLLAAPPEFSHVGPTLTREQWLERFRNRDRRGDREFPTPEIGRYDKFELNIDLRTTFANPFDPDEVDLSAEFTSPSGKVQKIWGFYNPGRFGAVWMVRFSPTEIGTWKYRLHVRDREGTADSRLGEFRCVASKHHGFVTIAPNNRYLRYSDGTSFYGVGMWYNDNYGGHGQGSITEESLDELKSHGANFISFFHEPLETLATGLGRYDLDRCSRLDEVFQWCEDRDLQISWDLVFHTHLSETIWEPTLYRVNPYRSITSAKDFYGSEEAWKYQQKLYRYVIARWGYSRALYLWFVIDEINGTDGWVYGEHGVAENWCRKMNDFFHEHDPYGRPTTGTQSGGFDQWWPEGYRIFDVAGREIYEAQGHPMPPGGKPDLLHENPLRYSYGNYATQTQNLWRDFEKPAIIAESGWDHTYYEPGMPGYRAMYHNALWASLANGACATPFWWAFSPRVNDSVLTAQLPVFARFVQDIDFADAEWQPIQVEMTTGAGWAMKSDGLIFGWVANPMSGVAKETFTITGLDDGEYSVRLYHTWNGRDVALDNPTFTAANGGLSVSIPELLPAGGHANHIGDDVAFTLVKQGTDRRKLADQ